MWDWSGKYSYFPYTLLTTMKTIYYTLKSNYRYKVSAYQTFKLFVMITLENIYCSRSFKIISFSHHENYVCWCNYYSHLRSQKPVVKGWAWVWAICHGELRLNFRTLRGQSSELPCFCTSYEVTRGAALVNVPLGLWLSLFWISQDTLGSEGRTECHCPGRWHLP